MESFLDRKKANWGKVYSGKNATCGKLQTGKSFEGKILVWKCYTREKYTESIVLYKLLKL